MKKNILKIINIIRIITAIFFIVFAIIGFSMDSNSLESFIAFIILLFIAYLIYPNSKEKIKELIKKLKNRSKINIEKKEIVENKINDSKKEEPKSNNESESGYNDYNNNYYGYSNSLNYSHNCFYSGKKRYQIKENEIYPQWFNYWEDILKAYKDITIKFEDLKENSDLEEMKKFEKLVNVFFKDKVFGEAIKKGFLKDGKLNEINYSDFQYYNYTGRDLSEREFNEAVENHQNKVSHDRYLATKSIYDLYSKTLRRIGNYYKKYSEYELALNIFLQIKSHGNEGITDGKSIIKCKKELELKNKRLLKS